MVTSLKSEHNYLELPSQLELLNVYPNPFNPQATISYSSFKRGIIQLLVFDVMGRLIHSKEFTPSVTGKGSFSLDASTWSSGTYFVRLIQENQTAFLQITLVK